MAELSIGGIRIQRVEEMYGPSVPAGAFLLDVPDDALDRHREWLFPDVVDPASHRLITSVHSWLLRTAHHTVLIDSCYGNHKPRPRLRVGGMLETSWLDRLAGCGVRPEDVDFVMCTHLHADHVGWNTRLIDGRWVPTFARARYIFSRREYEHWSHPVEGADNSGHDIVFEDSVLPCMAAGLVTLVEDGHTIDDQLTVEGAHGHTIAHTIIRAASAGATGLFTGDVMHTPLQIAYPHINSKACELPDQARATRRRILEDAAEHGHMLLPSHFPAPHVCRVRKVGEGFKYLPGTG